VTALRRRVLIVGRTRYVAPFQGQDARKFAAVGELLEWRLVSRARRRYRDDRLHLLGRAWLAPFDGLLFNLRLPFRIAGELRRRPPDVVVAQDPYAGAAALLARRFTRSSSAVVVEVHGDWRTATRLYGRRIRALIARPADMVAELALRRADATRAVSVYTASLIAEVRGTVEAQFPAYLDLGLFTDSPSVPPPATPTALFVGVLERYKNIDGLLDAWPDVHARLPEARLTIVGSGSLRHHVERVATADASIEYIPSLSREDVAAQLDRSTLLVLPSRSEGMGRVVLESFVRGRPVIAAALGGLPELVHDGENGLLVDVDLPGDLANALVHLLADPAAAARLGATGEEQTRAALTPPAEYAVHLHELVELAIALRMGAAGVGVPPAGTATPVAG
jgi:glycosyltransferase involved in cell wall biosynthesis